MPKEKPNARYTGEFKQTVIEDMRENNLSQNETAAKYTVPRAVIQLWERIYFKEGRKVYTLNVVDEAAQVVRQSK